ncbi:hypothetical protein TNIN_110201, partial [Trichonephila inaurata madagascariensis]
MGTLERKRLPPRPYAGISGLRETAFGCFRVFSLENTVSRTGTRKKEHTETYAGISTSRESVDKLGRCGVLKSDTTDSRFPPPGV